LYISIRTLVTLPVALNVETLIMNATESALSEAWGPPIEPGPRPTVKELLWEVAAKYPGLCAIASVHQPSELYGVKSIALDDESYRENPYLRWTYKDLFDVAGRLISGLRSWGIKPGSLLFSFQQNGVESVLTAYAS
jgi:hypothetical protein